MTADLHVDMRSYGRRRGRRPSPRQAALMAEVLPRVRIDARAPRLDPTRPVWLEIGFGGGEHLIAQAEANRHVTIIGCEPFEDGVVKVLTAIEERKLSNILLHPDDARALLRNISPASIDRIFILFPDPWPKRRHQKRRLVATELLALLARVARPGAELRIATDIPDYARSMMMAFQAQSAFRWQAGGPADWTIRPDDWPQTRYEQKAVREGRRSCYLRFVRELEVRPERATL